jgi:hypothetical protein
MNEGTTDSNQSTIADDEEQHIPEKFKLDRKKIQTATLVDENDEINQLGLSVFNQADLERGSLSQLAASFSSHIVLPYFARSDRSSRQCGIEPRTTTQIYKYRETDPVTRANNQVFYSLYYCPLSSFLLGGSSLRSSISAKQQILSTIDRATYLASRKDVQKANIEKNIKELVRNGADQARVLTAIFVSRNNN